MSFPEGWIQSLATHWPDPDQLLAPVVWRNITRDGRVSPASILGDADDWVVGGGYCVLIICRSCRNGHHGGSCSRGVTTTDGFIQTPTRARTWLQSRFITVIIVASLLLYFRPIFTLVSVEVCFVLSVEFFHCFISSSLRSYLPHFYFINVPFLLPIVNSDVLPSSFTLRYHVVPAVSHLCCARQQVKSSRGHITWQQVRSSRDTSPDSRWGAPGDTSPDNRWGPPGGTSPGPGHKPGAWLSSRVLQDWSKLLHVIHSCNTVQVFIIGYFLCFSRFLHLFLIFLTLGGKFSAWRRSSQNISKVYNETSYFFENFPNPGLQFKVYTVRKQTVCRLYRLSVFSQILLFYTRSRTPQSSQSSAVMVRVHF